MTVEEAEDTLKTLMPRVHYFDEKIQFDRAMIKRGLRWYAHPSFTGKEARAFREALQTLNRTV